MGAMNRDNRMESMSSARIITQEEFDALISELNQNVEPEHVASISEGDGKLRRLEFNMMVLVGLILIVFILCRHI